MYQSALKAANKTYRQSDCLNLCVQRLIIDNCDCYWTRYTNLDKSIQPCLNLSQLYCINTQKSEFIITEECLGQCPLECGSVTYDIKLSNLDYPSESLYNFFQNDTEYVDSFKNRTGKAYTQHYLGQYLISIKIYYPFTQYTLLLEIPKFSWIDLFSQIGGSLGMMLGFSIFHFIELVEIFLLIIISLVK